MSSSRPYYLHIVPVFSPHPSPLQQSPATANRPRYCSCKMSALPPIPQHLSFSQVSGSTESFTQLSQETLDRRLSLFNQRSSLYRNKTAMLEPRESLLEEDEAGIVGAPASTDVLVDSVALGDLNEKHNQVLLHAVQVLKNRYVPRRESNLPGIVSALTKFQIRTADKRTARDRWNYAINSTLAAIRSIQAFRVVEPRFVSGKPVGAFSTGTSYTAHKIGFFMDDYRTQSHQFVCHLSNETRHALQKEPSEYTKRDTELIFRLTSTMPAFAKYTLPVRKALSKVTKFELYKQGRVIVREGHEAENFYFIISGQVEVRKNMEGQSVLLNILKSGDSFGELALLQNVKRAATVITLMDTEFLRVNKGDFLDVLKSESERDLTERLELLESIPLFKMFSKSALIHLAATSQSRDYMANQTIITEGDFPQSIVIIKDGHCRLLKAVRFLSIPCSKEYPDRRQLMPFPEEVETSSRSIQTKDPHTETFITGTSFIESGPQIRSVDKILKIKDCTNGDYFFDVAAVVALGAPNVIRATALNFRQQLHAKRSPFSIVSSTRVKAVLVSQNEFIRLVGTEIAYQIGHKYLSDAVDLWSIQKLQREYLRSRGWKLYKQRLMDDLLWQRKLKSRPREHEALPRIA
ncbi:uncharacterized protein BJ171DRAFT_221852 [Polychytrium aggregatum]|uniref:uncharacterized protein n=1 Tax=Polychytrium aggregatum TaxID=110093 RepID=UPI0022FE29D2|nr:uncharacterized protein BJ171DRAFT_221852 [Polychytrium aggregatum]KAI9197507.1 hypothetical protein BJ171DRAFT_221852 [Polychytrium aggregatum]